MKKIIAIILVTVACVMALSSCSLNTPKPLDLTEKLDEAGYYVEIIVDKDTIKRSYGEDLELRPEYMEEVITVVSYDDEENPKAGVFVYYSNAESAKAAVAHMEDLKNNEETAEQYADISVNRQGKLVFIGNEEFWNAAF